MTDSNSRLLAMAKMRGCNDRGFAIRKNGYGDAKYT